MFQSEFPIDWEPSSLALLTPKLRAATRKMTRQWQREIIFRKCLRREEIPDEVLQPVHYDQRPDSYWQINGLRALLANIKGAERRKEALRLLKENRLHEASEFLLADRLTDRERDLFGKIDPAFMGGEYLPDGEGEEVEIARVTMESTTQDVISVRARPAPDGAGIQYCVVDEYESDFEITPETSREPLTLGELVQLMDTAWSEETGGITLQILQTNLECSDSDPADYADFLQVESGFYPDIGTHYWFAVARWVEESRPGKESL